MKEHLATEFQEWMQEVRAVETPLFLPDHGQQVTDAYFAGAPPFRSPKHRPDIPDSFIWEAALDIAKNCRLSTWSPRVGNCAKRQASMMKWKASLH